MIKILSIVFCIFLVILAIFGFLILLEYCKYFKRVIVLRLRDKYTEKVSQGKMGVFKFK